MNRIFHMANPFRVPDGTLVSPFLNPKDVKSGLSFNLLDGFSLAAGTIEPRTRSKIHIMPFVTQVTFVRRGTLVVQMKATEDKTPYSLQLRADEAVLTRPGTFCQLINDSDEPCEVLYIVSPAYFFEVSGEDVTYDDSVALEEDWEELEASGWQPSRELPTEEQRREAEYRLAARRA